MMIMMGENPRQTRKLILCERVLSCWLQPNGPIVQSSVEGFSSELTLEMFHTN